MYPRTEGSHRLNNSNLLVLAGSLCMIFALVLAWCLVGVRSSSFMKAIFPSYPYLLKAHLDNLMISGLLDAPLVERIRRDSLRLTLKSR